MLAYNVSTATGLHSQPRIAGNAFGTKRKLQQNAKTLPKSGNGQQPKLGVKFRLMLSIKDPQEHEAVPLHLGFTSR